MTANVRLRAVATSVRELVPGVDLPYVALEYIESGTGKFVPGFEPELKPMNAEVAFRRGDVLFGKLRPYLAKVLDPDFDGAASGELLVFRPRPQLRARYLYYLCLSQPFLEWAEATSVGAKMPRTDWDALSAFRLQLPSPERQKEIADFLDRETARIEETIHRHARLESLSEERYLAALSALFLTPEWPVTRLKHLLVTRPSYGVLVPRFVEHGGTRFIRVNDLANLESRADELIEIDQTQSNEYRRTVVAAGDVLVSVVGSLDRVAVVAPNAAGSNIARAVARLQPRRLIPPELLAAWTRTAGYARQAADATTDDSVQPTLNMGDLANFELRFPMDPASQGVALETLGRLSAWGTSLRENIRQQVALLRERRQALITASVTGQIDLLPAA